MKKIGLSLLVLGIVVIPLFSDSPNVKGVTGLFEIAYPFTLPPGDTGFSFGVNNTDLKTGDVDADQFYLGMGWGVYHNVEFNVNVSCFRVESANPWERNVEYIFAGQSKTGAGYLSFALKSNVLKSEKTGLGAMAYLDFRLSGEKQRVTSSKSSWGLDLLFAHKFSAKTIFSVNLGSRFNHYPDSLAYDPGDSLRYAAGLETKIIGNFSAAVQLAGKVYYSSDLEQDNPLDGIIGLKYENKDKYGNNDFGISLAYKKNLAFNNKSLANSHGVMGSVWVYIGQYKDPCKPAGGEIKWVSIEGDGKAKIGEVKSYRAVTPGGKALTGEYRPILYVWRVSANGRIRGQGSPAIDVYWEEPGEESWVQVRVSNKCTSAETTKTVMVNNPPIKEESFTI
ncbi:MAG: hypothetical protein PVH61_10455 [Candidatus Aminicenantes bacterium]|jgi:hypothetical protein